MSFLKEKTRFDNHRLFLVLPVFVWLFLCVQRPWQLGFYFDDWLIMLHPKPGSLEAFRDILPIVRTRPGEVPFIWLAQVFADWSPARAQIFSSLMLAASAASVGWLAARLISLVAVPEKTGWAAGSMAAAFFVCFPATLGMFAWSTGMIAAAPVVMSFCCGMALLIGPNGKDLKIRIIGIALVVYSHLSYEAFYFQEVIVLLAAACLAASRNRLREWMQTGAILVFLNFCCIAFNRLSPGSINKQFNAAWLDIFTNGYAYAPRMFYSFVGESSWIVSFFIVATLVGFAAFALTVSWKRAAAVFALFTFGIVCAGILFALAGYGLAFEGVMSRTAVVISTYFSLLAGLFTGSLLLASQRYRYLVFILSLPPLTVIAQLSFASHHKMQEWRISWQAEQRRLARLPAAHIFKRNDAEQAFLVVDDEAPVLGMASAPWEVQGAVAWKLNQSSKGGRVMMDEAWHAPHQYWVALSPNWFSRWNGKTFEQGFCSNKAAIYKRETKIMSVWETAKQDIARAAGPFDIGCGKER